MHFYKASIKLFTESSCFKISIIELEDLVEAVDASKGILFE
jgi:hypothetical protein